MTDTALSPEEQLIEDIAGFTHDPLGYALYAFPWGEEGTELAHATVRNIQSVFLVVRTSPVAMSVRNYSSLIPELILILAMKCQKNYVATSFL